MSAALFADLTTIRVGGPARLVIEPETHEGLIHTVRDVWSSGGEWLILGGGSNLVVSDRGFDGTVVRVATRGIERLPDEAPRVPEPVDPDAPPTGPIATAPRRTVRLRVEAGEPWDEVVGHAVKHGWAGIEALSGIPGLAGAAPVQNIGAYGQEVASSLTAIEFLDYATGRLERIPAGELGLGYRTSVLKQGRQGLVIAIELALVDDPASFSRPIAYAQLADALGVRIGDRVPLDAVRGAVLDLRSRKGMLASRTDPDAASAGSFFTNPVVSEHFARSLPADAPRWPTAPDEPARVLPLGSDIPDAPTPGEYLVKLSAAWLIEHAGFARGFALPGSRAAISSKHTLAIVNRGGATADEVGQLASYIRTRVLNAFGVLLQPEPVLVGLAI